MEETATSRCVHYTTHTQWG